MSDSDDGVSTAEPTIELGLDPDDPSRMVTLPDEAPDNWCYIEGPETHEQTALLHSWCVQWADAGQGLCYVSPGSQAPLVALVVPTPHRWVR